VQTDSEQLPKTGRVATQLQQLILDSLTDAIEATAYRSGRVYALCVSSEPRNVPDSCRPCSLSNRASHGRGRRVTVVPQATPPVVFIIDDDEDLRTGLQRLLRSVGLRSETFASTLEFTQSKLPDAASCLLLDVRMPGMSGLDFQVELTKSGIHIPIIFMTGHGDIPMSVRAMKAGAVEFLTKPLREQDLLDAVRVALEREEVRRESETSAAKLRALFDQLTSREQEVLSLVTAGLMNKQVAGELGVSEIMVKVHRGNVMRKMGARSLADLVIMAEALGMRRPKV